MHRTRFFAVIEPTYKRLKAEMAQAPTDKQGWKAIKSDALILAEGGNLFLLRKSEKLLPNGPASAWPFGRRNAYECNSCHRQFAGGKHQLAL